METHDSALPSINLRSLTSVARQASRRDTLHIRDWQASRLGGGAGNPVSAGLYRFQGSGQDRGEQVAWSAILKILQSPANAGWTNMGEGDDQTHWNYWKREMFVYRSGLLADLPEGITAPQCFAIDELPGDVAWLWLEDVTDSLGGAWSLDRYALTARHLGRLNGMLASRPLPAHPWLGINLTKQWVAAFQREWQSLPWGHPRVLARYPTPEANSFRRMLAESGRFLAGLDLLPRTVCHGDTYPTNFMSRRSPGGQEHTVALDWALAGIGPVGDDLGQLAFGAHTILKEAGREQITPALFDSYLDGLRDSGCRIDPRLARFGFAASAALRVGLFQVFLLSEELKRGDAATGEAVEPPPPPAPDCFEVTMANEAFALLESM